MARRFGDTWWGTAWLESLEKRALEDPNRLPRGRTYARQGRVGEPEIIPGLVRAVVAGSRREPYRTQLSVRTLDDDRWSDVLDDIVERAALSAALLSAELPRALGDTVLPRRGDLSFACSCPDWADPCKHAAALCYSLADVFDGDPFAIMLLRGRGRDELLDEVRRRRSAKLGADPSGPSDLPRGPDPGTSAAAALRREPQPLQRSVRSPAHPGALPELAAPPPAGSGVDSGALSRLVADAAHRAFDLLGGTAASGLELSFEHDLARRAELGDTAAIAAAAGRSDERVAADAIAWGHGGADGVAAAHDRWEPDPARLAPGAIALGERARLRNNRVSLGNIQLRLDQRGRWWRFETDDELGWVLAAPPADDPADLTSADGAVPLPDGTVPLPDGAVPPEG